MALSTYMPLPDTLADELSEEVIETTIFMAHGRQDDVIAYEYAVHSKELLEANNLNVLWHEYDMGHSVCLEEIQHIRQWLTDVL